MSRVDHKCGRSAAHPFEDKQEWMKILSVLFGDKLRINGNDLFATIKMTSMSGYITVLNYLYGSDKGNTHNGDLIASPFKFGKVDKEYTGANVVETYTVTTAGATQTIKPVWGTTNYDNFDANGVKRTDAARSSAIIEKVFVDDTEYEVISTGTPTATQVKVEALDGDDLGKFTLTFASSQAVDAVIKYGYVYDNTVIPQGKLPTIRVEMQSIPLVAKAYYNKLVRYTVMCN